MSEHEVASRAYLAFLCGMPPERWTVVRGPTPGVWYDFADAESELVGQCKIDRFTGGWVQPPRGYAPVVLEFNGMHRPAWPASR